MLREIGTEQHQVFKDAIRAIFPVLCFAPDQINSFIGENLPRSDGKSYVVEDSEGRLTFCRCSIDDSEVFVDYIIPSVWEDRYALVEAAILQLKEAYLTPDSERCLRMHVDERLPSHAAYYLGLLPVLGFTLTPRVTMTAPRELVGRLAQAKLPDGFVEVPYQGDLLEEVAGVSVWAYSGKTAAQLSAADWACLRDDEIPYITSAFQDRRAAATWTGIEYQGQLIGCSFGEVSDDRMKVEEVFVVPEHHGKGLGRYLTICCMQKLHQEHGGPDSYFFLGTDRRWTPALGLYHSIGFAIDRVESYAILNV